MISQATISNMTSKNVEFHRKLEAQKVDKIVDELMKNFKEEISNTTFEIEEPKQEYRCTQQLTDEDIYKLVSILDYNEKVYDINQNDSNLIMGSIESYLKDNPYLFSMCKITFCKDNDLLKEGCLLINDSTIKYYAQTQKDDLFRSNTLGKVVKIYDDIIDKTPIYFTADGEKTTEGRYNLSKQKKLNISDNPSVIRRKSSTTMINSVSRLTKPTISTPKPLISTPKALTRKPSLNNISSPILSPRAIFRYKLIKYI
jgi:hypothetical protein